eukprot:CAMPEP_0181114010 /NCGR_PEP_ID=MMETSP1071-20121207/20650_1 /TAXON_ID=35127 /ORGANISM="Thalassiosira sp., Strain NH16" /LENGTH=486 /DNA_ID=CAMNT_0023198081 /DNA_START=24 /DNA_END=1484 /DNA_ORIENTATION=+
MIIPSRSAAAALAPFALATIASGQRVIFIPTGGSGGLTTQSLPSSLMTGGMGGGEPPCRQRRLEPWRRRVREMCRAEAEDPRKCHRDVLDDVVPRSLAKSSSSSSSLSDLSTEMDSFFESLFAPSQQREEEDPFERIFNGMMGFSLRAFDEMAAMDGVVSGGEGEEEVGAIPEGEDEDEEEAIIPAHEDYGREEDERVIVDGEGADIPTQSVPEQAAENVLDFMVASLAQRSAAAAAQQSDQTKEGLLPSVHDIPDRLFRLGDEFLAEVRSHRRLAEDEEDPRSQAKERLARRLTEYRSDLVWSPADGTVTMYTVRSAPPPAFLMMGGGGLMTASPPTPPRSPLGMGSRHLDECVALRFEREQVGKSCSEAVNMFYLAVDDRNLALPPWWSSGEEGTGASDAEEGGRGWAHAARQVLARGEVRGVNFHFMGLIMLVLVAALLTDSYYNHAEEDVDEEGASEFDYGELPEDDADNERVFVGVPVQVV